MTLFESLTNIFKKPVSKRIEEQSIPDWSIYGVWLDVPITKYEFWNTWLPAHCLLFSEPEKWPEEYGSFANQLSIPKEHFQIGRVVKEGNKFLVYGMAHDGTWVNPETAYIFNNEIKVWEETPWTPTEE